jgi:hypothetical protein
MAKCDEGYLCEVCGKEVEGIQQSDLYLRFVIGEMDPERLHTSPERHIQCNPVLAQFINDDAFALDQEVPEGFEADELDARYAAERTELVSRGYRRLKELAGMTEELPIYEYPLPDQRAKWK